MDIDQTIQQRYHLKEILGQGSMGTTYKALDLKTRHPVAVKLLHFSRIREWKAVELFEREARILQQLNHPRIPTYIDYFSLETAADVQFFLIQEYIEGKNLEQLIERGWRGTEAQILEIFLQLIRILTYLHSLHPPVIHRDINPKNIILSPDRKVYLVDFGAVQERIRTTFLGGSTIVGTFGYIPFEQFSGHTVPASDYYASGATSLYMLTHRHPADFPTENLKPAFHDALQCSPKVIRLLDGLLEPDVKKRIASLEEVTNILTGNAGRPPEQPPKFRKSPRTSIKKVYQGLDQVAFLVPNRMIAQGLKRLFWGGIVLAIAHPLAFAGGLPGLLFGLLGLGLVSIGLNCIFGRTVLKLSPEWTRVSRRCFGFEIGPSQRIPTALIQKSDITGYYKQAITSRWRKRRSVLGINHAGKTLEIGTRLTQRELEWLIQEIHDYVTTFAKPLPGHQANEMSRIDHTQIE